MIDNSMHLPPHITSNISLRNGFRAVFLGGTLLLSACGGGGSNSTSTTAIGTSWTAGVYKSSASLAAYCANPRSGVDPYTQLAYPDKPGTVATENDWLRSWTHELYLWYQEVPDIDPNTYSSTANYFDVLKTTQTTASGQPKDRFHFTYPTAVWEALSQSGVQAGYGAQWAVIAGAPPRDIRVAYTEPNSPATAPGVNLARGATVLAMDGIDVVNANDNASIDALNAAFWPSAAGQSHMFTVQDNGASTTRTVNLTSADITSTPVQNVQTISTGSGLVGYMLFNAHIATSEQELIDAITALSNQGVTDLVLDIRYNGGGYLDIASELAYMIAGPAATTGKTFEETQFNDQYTTTNPVTGSPLTPVLFHSTAEGFSATAGTPLPTLNLSTVYVLTGTDTCSASESIINSLRGIDVNVIQIGSTTCGKPYGFYPADNCGTTYFSIQFKGVNNKGFGDYGDGFSPANSATVTTAVPGCSVGDDFNNALGNPAEARLAAALNYRNTQSCPAASGFASQTLKQQRTAPVAIVSVPKSPWLENRIMR